MSAVADGGYTPRYNVAPGVGLAVVTAAAPDETDRHHWGFVPDRTADSAAGLINARAETHRRVTVLTTDASDPQAPIHDRMPVVLPADAEASWLSAAPAARAALCRP